MKEPVKRLHFVCDACKIKLCTANHLRSCFIIGGSYMSKEKKQPSTRRKGARQRRRRFILLAALIAAAAILLLGIRLFGEVKVSSPGGDVGSGEISTGTTASVSQTTAATTTTTTTTARPTTVSGHYVQPAGAEWYLKLVNRWNAISEDYPLQLVTYAGSNQYDSRAIDSLRQMIKDGSAYKLYAASLYRDPKQQAGLYEREVASLINEGYNRADAEDKAAQSVLPHYTSEHNLGLAVDILGSGYTSLQESFENTDGFRWLKEHCADYGFILRYPKDKTSITGVIYEPWHYRYVGKEAAKEIMSRHITLEEYLEEKGK